MFSPEPKLYPKFISEEERIVLKNHAIHLLDTNVLQPNEFGPNRFGKIYFSIDELPEFHKEIYYRVVSTLQIKTPTIDPLLGIIISVIKPSGFIQSHTDAYKHHIETFPYLEKYINKKNFRFNVMVQRDDDISYSPHISKKPFIVEEKDAWCFAASELEHNTPPLKGNKYRIVYQFGFAV